ncbi:MAG TPA: M56 family metallopeptidase [Candidatus Baltobacteraceae bacterium]|nr:M56 family metallopeptidase [Candidatus Baltobacteraceae bacterium]
MTHLLQPALAIAAVLFDSLWEGALIAALLWLALQVMPQVGAATRYAIWICGLCALAAIPIATVALPATQAAASTNETVQVPRERAVMITVGDAPRQTVQPPILFSAVSPPPRIQRITIPQSLAIAAALLWLLLAGSRFFLLAGNLFDLVRVRRSARIWPGAHAYPVFLSDCVPVPIAVGFAHPSVLLPARMIEEHSPAAIEAIIAHETAHLRRYDVWTNLLARVLEALTVLNPAGWFMLRRLSIEREIACDDWVVAHSGSGDVFARALASMAMCAGPRAPLAAPSALGSRHSVVERIERLLDGRPRRLRLSAAALAGALAMFALVAIVMQSMLPVLAYAQAPRAPESVRLAGGCARPNHGVLQVMSVYTGDRIKTDRFPVPAASAQAAELKKYPNYREIRVAVVNVTFDAAGKARILRIISAPAIPDLAGRLERDFTSRTFEPALVNCVATAKTIRTLAIVQYPQAAMTQSMVDPAYPSGWSSAHPNACKVPNLVHNGVPHFANVRDWPALAASVRVWSDRSGAVTRAQIMRSSGRADFDDAVLGAARGARYPLNDATGFKPVRPNGAMLTWNDTHGYSSYSKCAPLPAQYVWSTTYTPSGLHTIL